MHLVIVLRLEVVVGLVVGLVVGRRGGELGIVCGDPPLQVGERSLDRLDRLAQFAQQLLLLLLLLVALLAPLGGRSRSRGGCRTVAALDLLQRRQPPFFEEIVDAAQVLLHAAVAKLVDLVDHAVQELAVVRDDNHRTVVFQDGALQNIFRAHVHVVRRLVEHEQVARFEHHARHGQTRPLAAREYLHLLVDILAAEEEGAQNIAQAGADIPHSHPIERVVDREIALHQVVLVLGVVADVDVGAEADRPLGGGQLPDDHACQRGLALAVAPDECDAVALLDRKIGPAEDVLRTERHTRLADLGHDLSRARRGRKLDVERSRILLVDFEPFEAFELLDARLHLVRLGRLVTELLDELLRLLDQALLVFVGRLLLRPTLGPQLDVFRIGDLVVGHPSQRKLHRARGDVVQKGAVVRNEQHGAVVVLQVLFEPLDRLDVEVVRRLVEQKDRGAPQEELGQLDAHAPAARELARGTAEIAPLEAQAEQRLLDVGLARVAAQQVVAVLRLVELQEQLRVGFTLVVGALGDLGRQALDLGFEPKHLLERLARLLDERRRVGHAHRLRQVADRAVAVDRHGARRGLLLARNQTQQGRLARTVAPHQADAVLGIYQKGYVVEKGPASVGDGEVVE